MNIASLWFDVDASTVAPPTDTREQVLPFVSLSWENFERLCFRLAHRDGEVDDARIYGERGQSQEGIDLYVRRATGDYAVWQCKRYQEITATDIRNAVTKFLNGDWAARSKVFRFAVASSLNATELAIEIETQRARCDAKQIIFEPFDQSRLSIILKDHPDLVDDFFGRPWVQAFNGADAVSRLSARKLTQQQKISARRSLLALYATHFQTVDGGIPAAAPAFRDGVQRLPVFDRYVEPSIEIIESIIEQGHSASAHAMENTEKADKSSSTTGFRRRQIRTNLPLAAGLAGNDRFILLGEAGFGKSAALRVIIHSLLSDDSRFPNLAKSWAQRLPMLLSFGFLAHHFAENETATIESALISWIKVLGARNSVQTLLEEMVTDERLLLLVDGLDEWQNQEAAVSALTGLSSYVQTRQLPLVATGRPLGFERISDFGPDWKRANLLPLSAGQQREFVTYWFRHFHDAGALLDATAQQQAVARDSEAFASELSEDPVLSELGGVPLLLSAMIYLRLTGRVLPNSKLAAIEEFIKSLLEDQPRRRAQAAMRRTDQSITRSSRIRRGLEYLAYCIHQEASSSVLSNDRAAQLLSNYFRSIIELSASEAEEWAGRVLELGRNEFGVLVAPQELHVALVHRSFQEYLAAKYIASLALERVRSYCVEFGLKAPWHEITLMLMQLLQRQNDVDDLIDELRKPTSDCLDEPLQQILLTRLTVAETNCSRGKARELATQIFSWIECGRWMALRLALVREIALGLESEHVGDLVATQMRRWFPGRVSWLHNAPVAAAERPTPELVTDLRIALHNCNSSYERRSIADALSSFAKTNPELADEFVAILKGPAEPELLAAALYALARGWPSHPKISSLLEVASASPAKELRLVSFLARFNQGERSADLRAALIGFCRQGEWPWPWEKDVMAALVEGWSHDSELKRDALQRIQGIGFPGSWESNPAIHYLLQGCAGDDDVARELANQLTSKDRNERNFSISDIREHLLAGFTKHPLLISAAEEWFDKNASFRDPIEVAVIARLGGTSKCRQALLDWLRRGDSFPAWIISTLLEISEPGDKEVQSVLADYMSDEQRRLATVPWLPLVVHDEGELGVVLRSIVQHGHAFDSCSAIELIVEREGRDAQGLWHLVEARLNNDKGGHYWRLGNDTIVKFWPHNPLIRRLAKEILYSEDIFLPAFFQAYGSDSEIRPLLDRIFRVLHEDLRLELIRAVAPLARRGVPSAVELVGEYDGEANGETRTLAVRTYAQACLRIGRSTDELAAMLSSDLSSIGFGRASREQAAVAALLEIGKLDTLASWKADNGPLGLNTYSRSRHNWEFIAAVVEHWERLVGEAPNFANQLQQSPVIATELVKAGRGAPALEQARVFEESIRSGMQIEVEVVRALIALHGRSTLLRDLFLTRLQHFSTGGQHSMMTIERAAYSAMASYIADHFHGDATVGETMILIAGSALIQDVALIALCRGWPNSAPIAAAAAGLPALIEAAEPVAAWLFALRADPALMASYLVQYPSKLKRQYFGEARDGIEAVRTRLQTDKECRELVFNKLGGIAELDTRIMLAKLIAPSMRNDTTFRSWIMDQVWSSRAGDSLICRLAFDVLSNRVQPVEFALFEAALTDSR